MFGRYGEGGEFLPRVLHLSIARYNRELPRVGEPLEFLMSIHEEGTGITWQQNVTVDPETEKRLVDATHDLLLWSVNLALTPDKARKRETELGTLLHDTFIGTEGKKVLSRIRPTAILLNVDETILNLPWELMGTQYGPLALETPLGRLVTTRNMLRPGRDPLQEDTVVRILVVANPTQDLAASKATITALQEIEQRSQEFGGVGHNFTVEVDVLTREAATRARFSEMLAEGDYDMLHFAGHGFLDRDEPGLSALRFADGDLAADEVLDLPWAKPPYFVFNSACESGRAVAGQRLVSGESQTNGLAASFLAAGVEAYAGYFWPVTDAGAGIFAGTFYRSLFERENVGLAFLEARRRAEDELSHVADLTSRSAILFGDAASKHRRELMTAV
ncbi:MAG: CHAT domain-containing protein [Anaerolineae bacterium]|jgi:hypothetical protein